MRCRVCSSGTGLGLRSVMSLLNGSAAGKFRRRSATYFRAVMGAMAADAAGGAVHSVILPQAVAELPSARNPLRARRLLDLDSCVGGGDAAAALDGDIRRHAVLAGRRHPVVAVERLFGACQLRELREQRRRVRGGGTVDDVSPRPPARPAADRRGAARAGGASLGVRQGLYLVPQPREEAGIRLRVTTVWRGRRGGGHGRRGSRRRVRTARVPRRRRARAGGEGRGQDQGDQSLHRTSSGSSRIDPQAMFRDLPTSLPADHLVLVRGGGYGLGGEDEGGAQGRLSLVRVGIAAGVDL